MFNKQTILLAAIFGGLILYNVFFWHAFLGLNVLIFDSWIILFLYFIYREQFRSPSVKLLTLASIYSGLCVVFSNSVLSIIMAFVTCFLLAAFVQMPGIRSSFAGQYYIIMNLIKSPIYAFEIFRNTRNKGTRWKRGFFWIRIFLLPIVTSLIFIALYSSANEIFKKQVGDEVWKFFKELRHIFDFITVERFFFLVLGFIIISGLIFKFRKWHLTEIDEKAIPDSMKRLKSVKKHPLILEMKIKMMGLKNEYITGVILFIFLNIILLILNALDLRWVWFYWPKHPDFPLKEYVHDGTFLLIFSIILASSFILYYFRCNQNFYSRNKLLQVLVRIWIIQNGFLVVSVLLRDIQYINFHGMAWLRLMVILYLALTLTGLITIYIKIAFKKTLYWVISINGWAAIILLLLACPVRWDMIMAQNNIHHWNKGAIDVYFYNDLPDACLPLILKDTSLIKMQFETKTEIDSTNLKKEDSINYASMNDSQLRVFKRYPHLSVQDSIHVLAEKYYTSSFRQNLTFRKNRFIWRWEKRRSWKWWNYRDYATYKALKAMR